MTTEQQREACAQLARRIGNYFWFADSSPESEGERWLSTRELMRRTIKQYPTVHETVLELPIDWEISDVPDYFTDPVALRELVAWLAADDTRWQDFAHALYEALGKPQPHLFTGGGFYASLKPYLTAEPSVIARAACKALGIEVSE